MERTFEMLPIGPRLIVTATISAEDTEARSLLKARRFRWVPSGQHWEISVAYTPEAAGPIVRELLTAGFAVYVPMQIGPEPQAKRLERLGIGTDVPATWRTGRTCRLAELLDGTAAL